MSIQLIVGLRNPGNQYAATRHNAGGWYVDELLRRENTSLRLEQKLQAELVNIEIANHSVKVMKPLSYMNLSGFSVRAVSQFYRIPVEDILVAHDDLDLAPGTIRLKTGGGHGGHNGLRDIINQLGSPGFHRLRIGIGHPGHRDQVLDYVLGKPSLADKQLIMEAIDRALAVSDNIAIGKLPAAMSILNI